MVSTVSRRIGEHLSPRFSFCWRLANPSRPCSRTYLCLPRIGTAPGSKTPATETVQRETNTHVSLVFTIRPARRTNKCSILLRRDPAPLSATKMQSCKILIPAHLRLTVQLIQLSRCQVEEGVVPAHHTHLHILSQSHNLHAYIAVNLSLFSCSSNYFRPSVS